MRKVSYTLTNRAAKKDDWVVFIKKTFKQYPSFLTLEYPDLMPEALQLFKGVEGDLSRFIDSLMDEEDDQTDDLIRQEMLFESQTEESLRAHLSTLKSYLNGKTYATPNGCEIVASNVFSKPIEDLKPLTLHTLGEPLDEDPYGSIFTKGLAVCLENNGHNDDLYSNGYPQNRPYDPNGGKMGPTGPMYPNGPTEPMYPTGPTEPMKHETQCASQKPYLTQVYSSYSCQQLQSILSDRDASSSMGSGSYNDCVFEVLEERYTESCHTETYSY